jgi:hypothetical protein
MKTKFEISSKFVNYKNQGNLKPKRKRLSHDFMAQSGTARR